MGALALDLELQSWTLDVPGTTVQLSGLSIIIVGFHTLTLEVC